MTDTWLKAINEGKLVGCAMIDFRKAFDLVDHELLVRKLRIYKFGESNYLICLGLNHILTTEPNK